MTTLGIAAIAAVSGACWWPVARAVARRIDRGRRDLAPEVDARLTAVEAQLAALTPQRAGSTDLAVRRTAPVALPQGGASSDDACRPS